MGATLRTTSASGQAKLSPLAPELVAGVLDTLDHGLVVAERGGRLLLINTQAQEYIQALGYAGHSEVNLFRDLLKRDPKEILGPIEKGEREIEIELLGEGKKSRARVHWMPEPDWLIVQFDSQTLAPMAHVPGTRLTVQELLQEREITYRNLLAAYLKLQEVNRQKTLFLASAAHELKTPLAVIKGYYDLLLTGSLGRLTEKQRDILEESKESAERLVRLVSMFLNYSALERGKLVLQLRDNDLRDCLSELATRWHEAFVRKHVRLDTMLNSDIPIFKFDYQKVQQTVANLLDNALKHTPAGGNVALRAEMHFWERRSAEEVQTLDRRRERVQQPNCI